MPKKKEHPFGLRRTEQVFYFAGDAICLGDSVATLPLAPILKSLVIDWCDCQGVPVMGMSLNIFYIFDCILWA